MIERFTIYRRYDGIPCGDYKSYAHIQDGTVIAAVDDETNKILELDGYKGRFRMDENYDLVPLIPDQRYIYYSNF
jgi:hypothetical protein